jgi:thioredoxin
MRNYLSIALLTGAILFNSCGNGQTQGIKTNLNPKEFAEKISTTKNPIIIDVRTEEEYSQGHLANAYNFDWYGSDFEKKVSSFNKTNPIFVYCLSGGRSSSAASRLRSLGFTDVYELHGGMMKWRAAGLPETKDNTIKSDELSLSQFNDLLKVDKIVLVDFYADWCAPCKKMKPYFDEIATEMADKVIVIRIDADKNPTLCKQLKIDALPVIQVYNNQTLKWSNSGFIEKKDIVSKLF